jgi:hypothetical protein
MTFLNPAVLFGLLAASIPILIHLLNLRKLKRIEFSTLMFLKELQKNKIRKIKLKQWILLILRVLIVLFLVIAFARPTLEGITIGGASSTAKTTAVFIFDNTFSMEVVDTRGSYFNQAKNISLKLLDQLQMGDEAALIFLSELNKKEISPTNNLGEIKKQVNDAELSSISGDIHSALLKAAEIVAASKNYNKEIYIISDFQKSRLSNENSLSNMSELLNDKVRLFKFQFTGRDVLNVGIDELKLNTQIFQIGRPIRFSVVVTNYSSRQLNNFVVSLFIQGERVAQKSIELAANQSKEVELESIIKSTGYNEAFVEIEDDEVIKDNRRYMCYNIRDNFSLLILYNNIEDTKYVELALKAGDETNLIRIDKKNLTRFAEIDLKKYNAIFIIGTEGISNIANLIDYFKNGNGVFLMPGLKSSLVQFQSICQRLNIPPPKSLVDLSNQSNSNIGFNKIDLLHPMFTDMFEEKSKTKIESPDIYSYFQFYPEGKGKNLITLMDNSSFLTEFRIEKGNLFLLSTSPILSHNNFPLKGFFVPLMFKSVFYLASGTTEDTSYFAGSSILLNVEHYPTKQIKVLRADKIEELVNLKEEDITTSINYQNTNTIGNYRFFSDTKLKNLFSVNANPKESNMKYLDANEFENYLTRLNYKSKLIQINPANDIISAVKQARFGSELWKYFIALAFLLALIEMFISRSAKKDLTDI